MMRKTQFEITKLQQAQLNTTVEAIAVLIFALFISAILPTLLLRYVYAGQQLLAQPKMLEILPLVIFAVGLGYGVYAAVINFMRARRIVGLEQKLIEEELLGDGCCGGDCGCNHSDFDDLAELDKMVDEVMAEVESGKTSSKTKKSSASSKTKSKKASKSSKKSK